METISARMNTEFLGWFEKVLHESRSKVLRELVDAGQKHKAVELYQQKKVSLGLGAKLAGVSLSEFIDLLAQHNAPLSLELDDAKKALQTAEEVL